MGTLNEDLTGIKAIEDKLTANKVANFAYTDHAYENPLTEADGVEYYNVDNEQNIPVPDPSVMDVNETVLTKGFRSQASSIPRMLMNHFLGRTSYNLNKLNDNMSSLLSTLMSHLGSANGIAPLNANGVLDIAKGGTNASTVNGARTNLNINNVVNTGDSATPTENGTTKFTTGGAYTELAKKADILDLAPAFSTSTTYLVGDYVIYNGNPYRCTVAHSAGAWNASHFTAVTVGGELEAKANKTDLAVPSDATLHYSFDDVPDFPDGTAIEKHIKDFTSVPANWDTNNYSVLSVSNGTLVNTVTNGTRAWYRINYTSLGTISGVIKIKIKATTDCDLYIQYYENTYKTIASQHAKAGQEYIMTAYVPTSSILLIQGLVSTETDFQLVLSDFYIGDGSYSTPIIDNSGDNIHAVNNGGIAVQGVCGKGLFCSGRRNIVVTEDFLKPRDTSSVSLSIWVKYPSTYTDTASRNLLGTGAYNGAFCIYHQYSNTANQMRVSAFVRASATEQVSIGITVTNNEWHHLVMVWKNKVLSFYVDNQKYTRDALSISDFQFGGSSWRIGDTGFVQGSEPETTGIIEYTVDDAQIFNRALSEDEVQALYLNKANTPKFYNINNYLLDNRSAVPAENGTDLFTTGGAYTLQQGINGKAPTNHASTTTDYGVASYDTYGHVKTGANLSVKNITEDTVYAPRIFVGVRFGVPDDILINKTGNSHTITVQGRYYHSPVGPSSGSQSYLVAILSSNPRSSIHTLEITSSQTSDQFSFTLPAYTMAFVFTTDIGYTVRGITT